MINVTQYVKSKLDEIKGEKEHQTYDSTIRELLFRTGYIDGKEMK